MLKIMDKTGFTLIELVLATAISAVVIGILSVCFVFALRVWVSVESQKPDTAFLLADLLQRQLAECEPAPIKLTDSSRPLFMGQANSITFVTSHSVKAISQGVSVVVRYTYDPKNKAVYYSELILDPYHPKRIEEFLASKSSGAEEGKIASYSVDFQEFSIGYAGIDSKQFSDSWEANDSVPVEVLVKWRGLDSSVHARRLMVNAPFTIEVPKVEVQNPQGDVVSQ